MKKRNFSSQCSVVQKESQFREQVDFNIFMYNLETYFNTCAIPFAFKFISKYISSSACKLTSRISERGFFIEVDVPTYLHLAPDDSVRLRELES